jgi:type II secretory pathway pseudopilin PulG
MKRRAFSLVELIAGLVFISIIAGAVATGGFGVATRSQQRAAIGVLVAAQSEVMGVVVRTPLTEESVSLQTFPVTQSLLASLEEAELNFTDSISSAEDVVSLWVVNELTAVFAVQGGQRCTFLVDNLESTDRWAFSEGTCDATNLTGVDLTTLSVDEEQPTELAS